jgi:hypothetical protein
MPETTKTYANMEILQGADYEIIITLDNEVADKTYLLIIRKDFTGSTDFGGSNSGGAPYRFEVNETGDSNGKLTATASQVKLNLYAVWTESLDDDFDGYWEMVEKDPSAAGQSSYSYSRIAQGEIYINNSASRLASITGRTD